MPLDACQNQRNPLSFCGFNFFSERIYQNVYQEMHTEDVTS